jgi:adenine-specific DNA-methyltransferase
MRYLGGKSKLLGAIQDLVQCKAPAARDLTDLFAGSGTVGSYFRDLGFRVTTNDILFFSHALARGSIGLSARPSFGGLSQDPFKLLDEAAKRSGATPDDFIYHTYSPASTPPRNYFTDTNALRIDVMRQEINEWRATGSISDDEYFYLLAAILAGAPSVANITGTYAAYLKHWDKRSQDQFNPRPAEISPGVAADCHNDDANLLVNTISGSVLYLDPPYNGRQYFPNYHVLETIALYDKPAVRGVTGQRDNPAPSKFCSPRTARQALLDLTEAAQFEHILLSYNSEGILSQDEIRDVLCEVGDPATYECREIGYRRYKSKVPNNTPGLTEYLFYVGKKP